MKKIAFVMTSLNTGGIATALVNVLRELSQKEAYAIDLILFHPQAKDAELLPPNVRVLSPGMYARLIAISQTEAKQMGVKHAVAKYLFGGICKLFGHGTAYRAIFHMSKRYQGYDVAISFSQSAPLHRLYGGCNEFVLNNIEAKTKIAFLHCDYVTYGINDRYSHTIYKRFDRIAAVSDSVGRVFLQAEPCFKDKVFTVRNCHDVNRILALAQQDPVTYDTQRLNILTVARLGAEKGHMRVLKGLSRLKEAGVPFVWHLVGGDEKTASPQLLERIEESGLKEQIVFHGDQRNPYRFMVNADFLLVPSYHEAAPMVFDEARLLHLPIVTTDTVSAKEMVGSAGIGLVCENTDEGLTDAICHIAAHRELLDQYRENTYRSATQNTVAIEQFERIIGDVL